MSTEILRVERALLCMLSPLAGSRSVGQMLVRATSAPVVLPAGSYAAPILVGESGAAGSIDWNRMVKTATAVGTPLPPLKPTPTTVTSAGTLVPCFSMIGGAGQNLADGTQVRWHPPIEGIEEVSVISGDMTGGTANCGPEGVSFLTSIDGLTPRNAGAKMHQAGVNVTAGPAIILSWESAAPRGRQKGGIARTLYNHTWRVYVIVPRYEGDHERRDDAKVILAAIAEILDDAAAVDGEHFASLHVSAGNWGRLDLGREHYVYWADFVLPHAVARRDKRTWNAFSGSRVQIVTDPDGKIQPPDPPIVVVDMTPENK